MQAAIGCAAVVKSGTAVGQVYGVSGFTGAADTA